jgi:hypothetical protein
MLSISLICTPFSFGSAIFTRRRFPEYVFRSCLYPDMPMDAHEFAAVLLLRSTNSVRETL